MRATSSVEIHAQFEFYVQDAELSAIAGSVAGVQNLNELDRKCLNAVHTYPVHMHGL